MVSSRAAEIANGRIDSDVTRFSPSTPFVDLFCHVLLTMEGIFATLSFEDLPEGKRLA